MPTISGVDIKIVHEFSDRLTYSVQSLETMGKLEQVNGYVSITLDKLAVIRGDLCRTDDKMDRKDTKEQLPVHVLLVWWSMPESRPVVDL